MTETQIDIKLIFSISQKAALVASPYKFRRAIVGNIMRELTALEINQFDFTGRVPDLNLPAYVNKSAVPAKAARRMKQPSQKRRLQLA